MPGFQCWKVCRALEGLLFFFLKHFKIHMGQTQQYFHLLSGYASRISLQSLWLVLLNESAEHAVSRDAKAQLVSDILTSPRVILKQGKDLAQSLFVERQGPLAQQTSGSEKIAV